MKQLTEKQYREIAEYATYKDMLQKFPSGIVSLVSDTYDIWTVITKFLPKLKDEILARDGKLVIRPDSGDPVDIICGRGLSKKERTDYGGNGLQPEHKGVIELLWDVFGGTVNAQGYKVLDSHIGAIYGDSINLERAEQMFIRLEAKGFASSNIVLGVGSFSLQFVTRDTHGFAQKATYIELGPDCGIEIFKNPITDDGIKKSAKGLLRVNKIDGVYSLQDQCTKEEEQGGELQVIYEDGEFFNQTTYEAIRERLNATI